MTATQTPLASYLMPSLTTAAYVYASTDTSDEDYFCKTQLINDAGYRQLQKPKGYEAQAKRNCNVDMRLFFQHTDTGLQIRGVCFEVTGVEGTNGVDKGDMALTRYGLEYWEEEEEVCSPTTRSRTHVSCSPQCPNCTALKMSSVTA